MLRLSNFLNIKKYFLFYTSQTIPKNRLACYLKPKPNHFLDNISVKVSHPNRWKPLSITVTVMESAFLEELREGSHFFHLQTGADVRAYADIQKTWNRIAWKSVFVQESVRHGKGCACSRTPGGAFTLCQSHSPHSARKTDLPFKSSSGPKGGSGLCYQTVWQQTVASQLLFLPRNTHTCLL